MEATNYTSIGPVLQLNKAGELTHKRIKAVKVCDGLYIGEPDKRDFVRYIIECNGVMWVEDIQHKSYAPKYAAAMPKALERVKSGFYGDERFNDYRHEIDRRVNHPDSPAIMELKKQERKKPTPLAENERKVSVLMFKGCTDEMTKKKVVITEVAPHIYTYAYKMKRYGERVKVIFEIDGVYFQGHDTGAYVLEREDFTEVCVKAYEHARDNVADGAASGTAYFIEVQKRIDAAKPAETPQISTEIAETVNVSAEGENAENESQKHISEVLKEAEHNYQCVKSETLQTVREADGKWHTYFMGDEIGVDLAYDQINHIPAARTAQAAEEVAEIRRYMNRLNGNHIADADYYLAEMREGIKQAEAARRKKNADTEGENKAERAENKPTSADVARMVKTELAKNKAMRTTWELEFPDGTECNASHKCTVAGCDFYEYTEARNGEEVFKDYKATERDITLYICQRLELDALEPPQSPETPQTVELPPTHQNREKRHENGKIGLLAAHRHLGAIRYAIHYAP